MEARTPGGACTFPTADGQRTTRQPPSLPARQPPPPISSSPHLLHHDQAHCGHANQHLHQRVEGVEAGQVPEPAGVGRKNLPASAKTARPRDVVHLGQACKLCKMLQHALPPSAHMRLGCARALVTPSSSVQAFRS